MENIPEMNRTLRIIDRTGGVARLVPGRQGVGTRWVAGGFELRSADVHALVGRRHLHRAANAGILMISRASNTLL